LAASAKVNLVTYFDENYPALLKEIYDPPVLLYVKGALPKDSETCLAVIGSREATVHGLEMASVMGHDLAEAGAVVVSGLARGIDSAAHRGALEAKGRTVAVLGCGLARMYPPENKKLAEEIVKKGALVSEFLMKEGPELYHFPMRNRIISGMSRALVVVEAREKSGALITVGCALEQGRDVYALPGNAGSKKTLGSNGLLKQGAIPVTDASDILHDFGLSRKEKKISSARRLSKEESGLLRLLDNTASLHLDEIVEKSVLPAQKTMALLTALAVKGAVRELPGKYFTEVER
jgi:DNA processing protein